MSVQCRRLHCFPDIGQCRRILAYCHIELAAKSALDQGNYAKRRGSSKPQAV